MRKLYTESDVAHHPFLVLIYTLFVSQASGSGLVWNISRYRSRCGIKSCNPKNQIWDDTKKSWYLSRSGCGIKSGIHTHISGTQLWLPRGARGEAPFLGSARAARRGQDGRRLGAFAQRGLAHCTYWVTCRELFGLFRAKRAILSLHAGVALAGGAENQLDTGCFAIKGMASTGA